MLVIAREARIAEASLETAHMVDFQDAMATWDVKSIQATKYLVVSSENMIG